MTTPQIENWERLSALCGALAWAILAGLAGFRKAPLGVIELLFLFAPLVIVPLGLSLGRMVSPLQNQRVETLLCLLQPIAAASTILSFGFSLGWVAGVLAAPWLLFCAIIAVAGA
jgi:hypothetical protein